MVGLKTVVGADVGMEFGFKSMSVFAVAIFDEVHGCPWDRTCAKEIHCSTPFPLDGTFGESSSARQQEQHSHCTQFARPALDFAGLNLVVPLHPIKSVFENSP